jgi:hypothetical protein
MGWCLMVSFEGAIDGPTYRFMLCKTSHIDQIWPTLVYSNIQKGVNRLHHHLYSGRVSGGLL